MRDTSIRENTCLCDIVKNFPHLPYPCNYCDAETQADWEALADFKCLGYDESGAEVWR